MAKKSQAKEITDDAIITKYMTYVIENESVPKAIYKFCKSNAIKEEDFYTYFGSVESLQVAIWEKFYTQTKNLMQDNLASESFSNKEKMLTFFF